MKTKNLARITFSLLAVLCGLGFNPGAAQAQGPWTIVFIGSAYKYLDNGSNQGTAWRSQAFDDSGWAVGLAPLGYGQANLNTTISYGNNPANKYITTYFRHSFATPANPAFSNLLVRLRRDDGAIVYLNGQEVFRSNMSTGVVNHLTLAASEVTGTAESNYFSSFVFSSTLLALPGSSNVLAAEVHLASPSSPDLVFCAELTGNATFLNSLTVQVSQAWSTIANNFDHGSNTLSELFSQVLDGTEIYKWNPDSQTYSRATYDANSAGWVDTNANPVNFIISPGEAAWVNSPVAQFLVLTGQVQVVGYYRPPAGGRRFVGGRYPMSSTFTEVMGFAPIAGDKVELFDGSFPTLPTQATSTHVFSNGVWNPALPLLPPAKGMFADLAPLSSLVNCPTNSKTVQCDTPWDFDPPTPAGGCSSNVTITITDTQTNGTACAQVITRTWVATDVCSNSTSCSQTVTVVDTNPPQLTWFPDKTNECAAPLTFDRPLAQDACCPSNSLSWVTNYSLISSNQCQSVWQATWRATDCCSNTSVIAWQYVTVVDTTPPSISCPQEQVIPFGAAWDYGTPTAWDYCCSSNSITIQPVNTGTNFYPCSNVVTRIWSATDCCANSSTCTQTVTVITCPPAPTLTAVLSAGQLHLGWGPVLGDFGLQRVPGLGGTNPVWLPVSGVPTASWNKFNQNSNAIEQYVSADLPAVPLPAPNHFLRLASDPGISQDFFALPGGNWSNPPAYPAGSGMFTFNRMGGGTMQIADFNNAHALLVDGSGIEILTASNRSAWPSVLTGMPNLHEVNLAVVFAQSNTQPMELKAFDVNGQWVSSAQVSNTLLGNVKFWANGWPFGRFEIKMPGGGTGGLRRLDAVPGIPTIPLAPNCTDLRSSSYSVGPVPNPWVQPGFTITATNSSGQLETNTYIEAGPEGNGYHVEYSAQIKFPGNGCCRRIEVLLARASLSVEVTVTAYDASGTLVLGEKRLTVEEGNPTAVTFWPPGRPICSIVVRSATGQTRILKICCLPVN